MLARTSRSIVNCRAFTTGLYLVPGSDPKPTHEDLHPHHSNDPHHFKISAQKQALFDQLQKIISSKPRRNFRAVLEVFMRKAEKQD